MVRFSWFFWTDYSVFAYTNWYDLIEFLCKCYRIWYVLEDFFFFAEYRAFLNNIEYGFFDGFFFKTIKNMMHFFTHVFPYDMWVAGHIIVTYVTYFNQSSSVVGYQFFFLWYYFQLLTKSIAVFCQYSISDYLNYIHVC